MLEEMVTTNPMLALILLAVLGLTTLALGKAVSRAYQAGANRYYGLQGATPLEDPVQTRLSLKDISLALSWLAWLGILICVVGWLFLVETLGLLEVFAALLGGLMLATVAYQVTLLGSLSAYRSCARQGAISGRIEYGEWLVRRRRAADWFGFSMLLLFVFFVTNPWMVLGGALLTLALALWNWTSSRGPLEPSKSAIGAPSADGGEAT